MRALFYRRDRAALHLKPMLAGLDDSDETRVMIGKLDITRTDAACQSATSEGLTKGRHQGPAI
jgi:hypothetical protein